MAATPDMIKGERFARSACGGTEAARQFLQRGLGAAAAEFRVLRIALGAHETEGAVAEGLSRGQHFLFHFFLSFREIPSHTFLPRPRPSPHHTMSEWSSVL